MFSLFYYFYIPFFCAGWGTLAETTTATITLRSIYLGLYANNTLRTKRAFCTCYANTVYTTYAVVAPRVCSSLRGQTKTLIWIAIRKEIGYKMAFDRFLSTHSTINVILKLINQTYLAYQYIVMLVYVCIFYVK